MRALILGLDTFAQKNQPQLRVLGAHGWRFDIVVNDLRGDSSGHFEAFAAEGHRLILLPRGLPWRRLARVWKLLRAERYDAIELYATGRMASAYVLMLRVLRRPFAVIERGDIGLWDTYDPLTRCSLAQAYRHATVVVYKETYMPALLARWRTDGLEFIPNAVAMPDRPTADTTRRMLWVNRLIPQRRPEWLARAAAEPELADAPQTIMGFESRAGLAPETDAVQARVRAEAPPHAELLPFGDPTEQYRRATFFCMAAERIFGNNALLEAMAHGLVPVVNAADGVDQLVTDGVNGIVTAFDEGSYREGLRRAMRLPDAELRHMSAAARETVRERYSLDAWAERMCSVYGRLQR